MAFTPSPQQQAFFDWIVKGHGSTLIEAVAGAGKTTTLVHGVKLMQGNVFIAAYNRKIADEIKQRVEGMPNVRAGTFHSAGFTAWRRVANRVRVEAKKGYMIVDAMEAEGRMIDGWAVSGSACGTMLKLVSLAKQSGAGFAWDIADPKPWMELIDHHSLDTDMAVAPETAVKVAQEILTRSIAMDSDVIDFDDMIFCPLYHNVRMFQQDWLLVDEAQDTNLARRALARKMLKPGGRLVAVGDRHQAIYGFTGADADSMDLIAKDFAAAELPLTVTYRCPKAVVALAHQWVNHIQAHETAPEGRVSEVTLGDILAKPHAMLRPTDAILCRNTKPLIELAYQLIRKGMGCTVEGRDIGQGLIALARKWKVRSLGALADRLERFKETEMQKAIAKGQETKAQSIEDKVDTLTLIIAQTQEQGGSDINDLVASINRLFSDDATGLLKLSTVHKSKGREWERVFILGRSAYMPSQWARKAWQQQQEVNLMYVAVTRAKAELVDIGLSPKAAA